MVKKLLSLISGGIDSSVSSYMMANQAYHIDYIFFSTSEKKNDFKIVSQCIKAINKITGQKNTKLLLINYRPVLEEIDKRCPKNLQCVLCKRMMYRIAEKIGRKKYVALLTGESLGQVASQTFENLVVEDDAVGMIIIRPLIGFDKAEIIKVARKIGTLKYSDKHRSCDFVPKKPRTKSNINEIAEAEKKLEIKKLMRDAIKSKEVIKF
ncbi:MAG: hypothetical protein B6U68_01620 [Candidatus Aenigmarchaeota archaeon ex4484_14]|nr:MAG: hypothetical protein B6U68_01620 [Candidatus Aenigmarchaeota archaeon ex4484_14]RLJ05001.1 MAG: hypothetical protein DRP08_00275 [Candidatus Aenigmarchaeota archaeon]